MSCYLNAPLMLVGDSDDDDDVIDDAFHYQRCRYSRRSMTPSDVVASHAHVPAPLYRFRRSTSGAA